MESVSTQLQIGVKLTRVRRKLYRTSVSPNPSDPSAADIESDNMTPVSQNFAEDLLVSQDWGSGNLQ